MTHHTYLPQGTCSFQLEFDIEERANADGSVEKILHNVVFYGGCSGNLQGVGRLVEGMPAAEVHARLRGISCNGGPTSCPDQLALALEEVL